MNPFVRYRERLDSYRRALDAGMTDADFIALVERLDAAVAEVDGHGFTMTPTLAQPALSSAADLDIELWVKDETHNVSGSHKARHLFGLLLHQAIDHEAGGSGDLAISSCGNAALAAAVLARAVDEPLRVFVPTWAEGAVVDRLEELDADITRCERRPGEEGDPCFHRYQEAVADGARPFTVQGTEEPRILDGGRTIGWELAEQLSMAVDGPARIDVVYVQVGGGALAACTAAGLRDGVDAGWLAAMPRFHAVQPRTAQPLGRAWAELTGGASAADGDPEALMDLARADPDDYMQPWPAEPVSVATGILDDVTYDWLPVTAAMLDTGGWPVLADESTLSRAHELAHAHTDIPVCVTGAAGFAGLLTEPPEPGSTVAVLFTGHERDD